MDRDEFRCQICSKHLRDFYNLRRHMKNKHKRASIDPSKIIVSNEKVEHVPSKIRRCPKCEFVLPNDTAVNTHLASSHKNMPFKHKCFICQKPFFTSAELQKHTTLVHSNMDEEFSSIVKDTFIFKHPFSMIVSGPSRSGKTYWVINLLLNAADRIQPSPNRIVYCYSHWQPKYDVLKKHIPSVEWHEGMPTKPFLDDISDAILILDDLMAESVNNSMLMNIFTERSHHQKISVILLLQNLYQQGKHSISIARNAQYTVLFKNPRDRMEIKTLAMRMFPEKWRKFLERFEYETSKPHGKVILDFSSDTSDENRIVKSCDLQDFFQNAQKQQAVTSNPYLAKAIDEKSRINKILDDPTISNPQKELEYGQAMNNYTQYMKKASPPQTNVFTVSNTIRNPISTITKPTPEEYWGSLEDLENLPYEPNDDFKDNLKDILELPLLPDADYQDDSGDEDHMKNFISLSDDENTVVEKQARAEYNFRKRVREKK